MAVLLDTATLPRSDRARGHRRRDALCHGAQPDHSRGPAPQTCMRGSISGTSARPPAAPERLRHADDPHVGAAPPCGPGARLDEPAVPRAMGVQPAWPHPHASTPLSRAGADRPDRQPRLHPQRRGRLAFVPGRLRSAQPAGRRRSAALRLQLPIQPPRTSWCADTLPSSTSSPTSSTGPGSDHGRLSHHRAGPSPDRQRRRGRGASERGHGQLVVHAHHDVSPRHLTDADLSPARIAHEHNISVRHLYNTWDGGDFSLAQWIMSEAPGDRPP